LPLYGDHDSAPFFCCERGNPGDDRVVERSALDVLLGRSDDHAATTFDAKEFGGAAEIDAISGACGIWCRRR
jgi:hypothetical protein